MLSILSRSPLTVPLKTPPKVLSSKTHLPFSGFPDKDKPSSMAPHPRPGATSNKARYPSLEEQQKIITKKVIKFENAFKDYCQKNPCPVITEEDVYAFIRSYNNSHQKLEDGQISLQNKTMIAYLRQLAEDLYSQQSLNAFLDSRYKPLNVDASPLRSESLLFLLSKTSKEPPPKDLGFILYA